MPDRELGPWQSGAVALFLSIEKPRGVVLVRRDLSSRIGTDDYRTWPAV
jgi:hypothetical protein